MNIDSKSTHDYCFMASVFKWEGNVGRATLKDLGNDLNLKLTDFHLIGVMSDDTKKMLDFHRVISRSSSEIIFVCLNGSGLMVIITKAENESWSTDGMSFDEYRRKLDNFYSALQ